ncbi:MAG: MFS transporter [Thermoguttaceae bacterium]|nr:MFS transporter [Thermoguttaceae bacterium]MBQ6616598.1 MFS transporter [Thermoguttaceae bacterium]
MNESQQHREEQKKFSSAQWTFFINSMIVYAGIYVVRNNLSMAQPGMLEEGVISTYALGTILTIYGVLYGVGQFVNSFWADRFNGRIFMTIGLAISALANFFFGCSSLTIFFAIFWLINGWGVSMGFPASTNMLTHWIHPKELATKMSIWTTSNNFGKVMVLGLCSLILGPLGLNWRWCFWVPGALVALIAAFCFFFVKASPTEAGVHELEVEEEVIHKPSSEITTADRCRLVFGNRTIWLVSIASIFVAVVSDIFLCWGPTFLKQLKGIPVSTSGWIMIAFQIAAIFGSIFAGWLTDNVFKGRGVRTCVIYMCCAALFTYGFWALPNDGTELQFAYNSVNAPKTENVRAVLRDFDKNIIVKHKPQENQLIIHTLYLNNSEDKKIEDFDDIDTFVTSKLQQKFAAFNFTLTSSKETASMSILMATLVLMLIGFFIQGTYGLLGAIVSNQATKEAAALANGFRGILGHASTVISGIGVAHVIENYGWSVTLSLTAVFALLSVFFFALAWNAKASGYKIDYTEKETATNKA